MRVCLPANVQRWPAEARPAVGRQPRRIAPLARASRTEETRRPWSSRYALPSRIVWVRADELTTTMPALNRRIQEPPTRLRAATGRPIGLDHEWSDGSPISLVDLKRSAESPRT